MGINFAGAMAAVGHCTGAECSAGQPGRHGASGLGAWLIRRRDTQLTLTNHSDIGRFMVSASA